MDNIMKLIPFCVVVCVATCIAFFYSKRKRNKRYDFIRSFIENVNNGERIVYGVKNFQGDYLIDENGECICFGDIHIEIRSSVFCLYQSEHRNIYQAYVDHYGFCGDTIILYLKPIEDVFYQCRVTYAGKYSITCYHPILKRFTLFVSGYKSLSVGTMITVRTKVTETAPSSYKLEYEIINPS